MALTPHFPSLPTPFRRQQSGFSIIELMVGLAVGLAVVLAVAATAATINGQRKATISGSNASESAQVALNLLDRAGRMAGAGLFYNGSLICNSINMYYNKAVVADGASFMPAKIVDGGTTGSDTITFVYSNAVGGAGTAHLSKDMPDPSSVFTVNQVGGFAVGDLALVGSPGSTDPCMIFGVTAVTSGGGGAGSNIQHNSGASEGGNYNPPNPAHVFKNAPAYTSAAIVIDVGSLVHDTYEVLCNTLVSHPRYGGAATCTASPLAFANATPLTSDIVQIQAQYGITASSASDIVTDWVDATNDWANPAVANVPRIKAIRLAVVARSKENAGSTLVSSNCKNAADVVNKGPCSFADAQAPVIDLSATSVPAGSTWQNYRYRVYQTVIPLRNVAWNYN